MLEVIGQAQRGSPAAQERLDCGGPRAHQRPQATDRQLINVNESGVRKDFRRGRKDIKRKVSLWEFDHLEQRGCGRSEPARSHPRLRRKAQRVPRRNAANHGGSQAEF